MTKDSEQKLREVLDSDLSNEEILEIIAELSAKFRMNVTLPDWNC